MYKVKLAMNADVRFGIPVEEQIPLLRNTGFCGFFTEWNSNISVYRDVADAAGMEYLFVHGSIVGIETMWQTGEILPDLLRCLEDCAKARVPMMVCHVWRGFQPSPGPTAFGKEQFRRFVDRAGELGVKIAFENTEGEAYLEALMQEFRGMDHVGFCWDSGHECCYNDRDMLSLYGDRVIATHLNDNLGIRDFGGNITFYDDLHLLPFDGVIDWQDAVARLKKTGYDGVLTFEVKRENQRGRHEHDKYLAMSLEQYFAEAYSRACRVGQKFIKML